jgi:alpha-tubulin suppressor-like RCC1 family protein
MILITKKVISIISYFRRLAPLPQYIPTSVDITNLAIGERFTRLTVGGKHSCGLTSIGNTFCWGSNSGTQGLLGNNSTIANHLPIAIDNTNLNTGENFVSISGGFYHTCGNTSGGRSFCWGKNTNGQLGDNSILNKAIPSQVDTTGL